MAGRRACIDRDKLFEKFCDFKENIIESGKVMKPTSKIWTELHTNLYGQSTPKAIYSAAIRWWQESVQKGSEQFVESELSDVSVETNQTASQSSFNNTTMSNPNSVRINFSIHISAAVWETIAPIPTRYHRKVDRCHKASNREYFVLKPGVWSTIILEKIADHRKNIICDWSFKKAKVYVSGKFYVVLSGKCVNCAATILGYVKNKPENDCDSVKFRFSVKNFNEARHKAENTKTVKNVGAKAKEVFTSSKPAIALHQNMASKNTSMFEKSKGRMFTLNAIHCGKYRQRMTKKLSGCPYTALEYLQQSHSYAKTIHMTGRNPFIVIYTSPNQIILYKAYKKRNRYTKMSGDATGGLARRLLRAGGQLSDSILLYSLAISDEFQISVHSMLVEQSFTNTNFIAFWLSEWLRLGGSIPNEFCSDMAMALIGAAVRAFAVKSSVLDYINSLFNLLNGKEDIKPKCFVRVDIAHFIKNVTSCKPLKDTRTKHRDFFIRSVVLMMKMNTLSQAREHILAVLVVAMSSTEGSSTESGCDTPCEKYKKSIIRKIKGIDESSVEHTIILDHIEEHITFSEEEEFEISGHDEFIEYMESDQSNFSVWIDDIWREAKALVEISDDGDRDNLMLNVPFAKYFRKLCKMLLLWSAICCPIFNSPFETSSSSNVESDFKNVKLALSYVIPCPVDVLVQHHLNMLDGAVKIASQKYLKFTGEDNSDVGEHSSESENEVLDNEPCTHTRRKVIEANFSTNSVSINEEIDCVACKNNDTPTGAHTCYVCEKNVHILPGCSTSLGDEEGFGERRICHSCSKKPSTEHSEKTTRATKTSQRKRKININDELNYKEQWNKKRKCKRNVYSKPAPNWDLITNVNKKVKLGFLSNGSISKTIHNVNKVPVSIGNTCAFDSITQILAAAYAYYDWYRESCDSSTDKVYEISILLAKNSNLKKINNLRAALLYNTFQRYSCQMVVSQMIKEILRNTPTYMEVSKCSRCKVSKETTFPIISVDIEKYADDMKNLEKAIIAELDTKICCGNCGNELMNVIKKTGKHLFVELPNCRTSTSSDYEQSVTHKLKDAPFMLNISKKKYCLVGQIVFEPPFVDSDIGHYLAAIKLNNKWELYDDLRSKPYAVTSNASLVIHAHFYILFDEKGDYSNSPPPLLTTADNSNDLLSTTSENEQGHQHTNDSLYRLYHQKGPTSSKSADLQTNKSIQDCQFENNDLTGSTDDNTSFPYVESMVEKSRVVTNVENSDSDVADLSFLSRKRRTTRLPKKYMN